VSTLRPDHNPRSPSPLRGEAHTLRSAETVSSSEERGEI
jgi:hypothetical protein